jgi:hypothetical protein
VISQDSRYAGCVLYVDDSDEFIGSRVRIDTTQQLDDIFYTVVECDRIDHIAYRYLGRAELWWIICDYNDIFFPFDIEPGTVLRLPSIDFVQMNLLG